MSQRDQFNDWLIGLLYHCESCLERDVLRSSKEAMYQAWEEINPVYPAPEPKYNPHISEIASVLNDRFDSVDEAVRWLFTYNPSLGTVPSDMILRKSGRALEAVQGSGLWGVTKGKRRK